LDIKKEFIAGGNDLISFGLIRNQAVDYCLYGKYGEKLVLSKIFPEKLIFIR
jgi:hypothetical protein